MFHFASIRHGDLKYILNATLELKQQDNQMYIFFLHPFRDILNIHQHKIIYDISLYL